MACAGLFVATHSELVSVPRNLVAPIPDGVSFEEASFVTLGAIALQGVRLAQLELGEHVLVYGLGLVGMLTAQLARAAGCHVIGVDIDPRKIELAARFGCQTFQVGADLERDVMRLTGGYGTDKVLLCAATKSNDPIETIPNFTRQKGVVVVIGDVSMNVPRRAYYDKEIDIRISRSYGPGRYDPSYELSGVDYPYAYVRWTENRNMESVLGLIATGRLKLAPLVTHNFDVSDALTAYELIGGERKEPYLGIVIRYRPDEAPLEALPRTIDYSDKQPEPARSDELRLGILGAGNFAKAFLLPAFAAQPGVSFRAICTASGVSAAAVAKKYRIPSATADRERVFTDAALNGLLIASRHDSHAEYVRRGLQAGKTVYVEKPLATTLDDLEAIRALHEELEAAGGQPFLQVGYNRRFSPLAVALREVVRRRREPLALLYRVNAGHVPATEWVHDREVGGGRIIGECCHFIDFLIYLTGSLPTRVTATPLAASGKPVGDVLTLTLAFSDGGVGTVHYFANGNSGLAKEYVEVHGGGISARLDNFRSLKVHGARSRGRRYYFNQVKGFREEAAAFVRAWRAGGPAPIPFAELYAGCKATILAEESARLGRPMTL